MSFVGAHSADLAARLPINQARRMQTYLSTGNLSGPSVNKDNHYSCPTPGFPLLALRINTVAVVDENTLLGIDLYRLGTVKTTTTITTTTTTMRMFGSHLYLSLPYSPLLSLYFLAQSIKSKHGEQPMTPDCCP
jgi:hypothetical protein